MAFAIQTTNSESTRTLVDVVTASRRLVELEARGTVAAEAAQKIGADLTRRANAAGGSDAVIALINVHAALAVLSQFQAVWALANTLSKDFH